MTVDAANAASGLTGIFSGIATAIRKAADATGASFEYLLATAKMESNFNPQAAAGTSSAKGLFQFIEQTWLGMVKEAGPVLGYNGYADAITKSPSGSYSVSDPATRAAILKLRDDPTVASAMAGVLTQSNSFKLTGLIGRRPTDSELYMAHFMGVGGAAKLIANAQDNPQASGARLFPNAAAANRPIFYDRDGRARSVSEVYADLDRRYAVAASSPATRSAMASLGVSAPVAMASAAFPTPPDNAAYLSRLPDVRGVTPLASATMDSAAPSQPVFRSLFQVGERTQPVSPAVQELWGTRSVAAGSDAQTSSNSGPRQPFDLFSDRNGTYSG
ncbi:transglycosylase SLT domain-containing protein [Nitrobacter sp. NHB1]|uniref:transglycosylase SLT domain-containing protein n=1 Tax=Nitrobacter sp. NHB1 TaxID=3119830 RepID=UPI002FFF98FF